MEGISRYSNCQFKAEGSEKVFCKEIPNVRIVANANIYHRPLLARKNHFIKNKALSKIWFLLNINAVNKINKSGATIIPELTNIISIYGMKNFNN